MEESASKKHGEPNAAEIIKAEIPLIEKIIRDETWLEGERRGEPVKPDDPKVMKKVCTIIEEKGPVIVAEAKQVVRSVHAAKPTPGSGS